MAFIELHDNEPPTLVGTARNIDFDYQAEQWVIDSAAEKRLVVRWVLFTDEGSPVREWRRTPDGFEEVPVSPGTTPDLRSLRR